MSRRGLETLTDILVLIVSPVLVMILVASLAFFLIQCSYDGQFPGRLYFATTMFVIAAVLVARIAIEEGREYASAFALPLGVVTILSIFRYTDIGILSIPLVLFIWWSTDKLTWDCSVLDSQKDASGKGLLQTIGGEETDTLGVDADATTDRERTEKTSIWQSWVQRRRRHHTPGVWVIYFGLAAIPLFGIGQIVLAEAGRGAAFLLLCTYVASALALLMITSFLQMRRYMLQRQLPITEKMAATWLGTGGVLIVGLMFLCLVLPRPNTGYSAVDAWSESLARVSEPDNVRANQRAVGDEGVRDSNSDRGGGTAEERADADARNGRQASEDATRGNQSGNQSDRQRAPKGKGSQEESQQGQPTDSKSGRQQTEKQSNQRTENQPSSQPRQNSSQERKGSGNETTDQKQQQDDRQKTAANEKSPPDQNRSDVKTKSPTDRPSDSNPGETQRPKLPDLNQLLPNLKMPAIPKLVYMVVIGLVAFLALIFYGDKISAAVAAFVKELMAFLQRLLGGRPRTVQIEAAEEPTVSATKPFRSYQDPFVSGMAQRWSPAQLIAYTFEALQAWAVERQCPHQEDQTPLEFAGQILASDRTVGPHARKLAVLYNQAAYAPDTMGTQAIPHIQALWKTLKQP